MLSYWALGCVCSRKVEFLNIENLSIAVLKAVQMRFYCLKLLPLLGFQHVDVHNLERL